MFLLGLLLLTGNANGEYNRARTWGMKPKVLICKSSKTKVSTVKSAIDFWKKEGFDIGSIYKEKNNECKDGYEYGYIIIKGQDNIDTSKVHGLTTPWFKKGTKTQVSATIKLNQNLANELDLVKHELGHGLGLGHTSKFDHVMSEYANY